MSELRQPIDFIVPSSVQKRRPKPRMSSQLMSDHSANEQWNLGPNLRSPKPQA